MNVYDLHGKTVIVTGGAGGFGRAIARRMLASGARVCLWDESLDGLDAATAELGQAMGGQLMCRAIDITDVDAIEAAVAAVRSAFGRLDVLVNNAGLLGETKPIWETDPAIVRRLIEVNLLGAYWCIRAIAPVMRAQEARPHRGHIVNVASIQGKEGMPFSGAYSASKAGLIGLTKSAAKELATDGIYVNCITPAAAETAMATLISPARKADILDRIPLHRLIDVDEVARMVAWLSSDECSFSTGAVFDLSGGRATY